MSAGSNPLLDRLRAATEDEYTIEGELGRGGMAAVFLARDIALDRRVAIKVMLPDLVDMAGFQDRFVIEARTAAHLDHPGIVTVYAVKQRLGLTFIVMKYIEGRTLDHVLSIRGALDPVVVATIGSRVAEALQFAHSSGVIHRDVKPSNIIIDSHGRPVVTDFGIAKVTTAPSITVVGSTLGTPAYMSPEQCRGLPATVASDQYSLGVMLYELLTGRAPFSGNLFELLSAHATDAPPPIRAAKPDVDPALEATIMRMLAKESSGRFPSLGEAAKALASRAPRRSHAAELQAIITAVDPERAEWLRAANATTEGMEPAVPESSTPPGEFTREFGVFATTPPAPAFIAPDTIQTPFVPGTVVVGSPRGALDASPESPPTAVVVEPAPRKGRGLLIAGVAAVLVVAAAYPFVRTRSDPAPETTVQQSAVAKPDSVPAPKPDTQPTKLDTTPQATVTPPPVAAPVIATTPSPAPAEKTSEKPKTTAPPKRDSSPTHRPDSIVARCQ
ncbi:MAG TPA: protein kinase, partial [Gemmatimonadaceae bacterium]